MQLFWGKRVNEKIMLVEGEEVTHLTKSLRNKVGDAVDLIDGTGSIFHSVITEINRGKLVAVIMSEESRPNHWPRQLNIAIAPTKNADRMEWFVEKAVEIGIDSISFIRCERSVRTNLRMERLLRIMQSAMKQSNNIISPVLLEMPLKQLLDDHDSSREDGLIAYCSAGEKISISQYQPEFTRTTILIGPEGDFTDAEINHAISRGFLPLTFGDSRLRTETAGLYAIASFRENFS